MIFYYTESDSRLSDSTLIIAGVVAFVIAVVVLVVIVVVAVCIRR